MIRTLLAALSCVVCSATVTAAVTNGAPALAYGVAVQNMDTGQKFAWKKQRFPDQDHCQKALGNSDAVLRSVADPKAVTLDFDANVDPVLKNDLGRLVITLFANTGRLPNLGISCEPLGDPA